MNARGCRNAGFVGIAASNVVHNYFAFLQNPCVICCLTLEQVQVQASNSFHHVAIEIFACVSSWLHSAAGYHTCNSAAIQCSATLPYQFGKHVLTIGPPVLTIYMFAELATFGFNSGYVGRAGYVWLQFWICCCWQLHAHELRPASDQPECWQLSPLFR